MYIMIHHNVKMFKCYWCMGVMYATAMKICLFVIILFLIFKIKTFF